MRNSHFDSSRRAVLGTIVGGTGALMLGAALWPARALAQSKSPIGIIGSGNIGGTIGGLWVKAGHPVMFSSRHPEELKDLAADAIYTIVEGKGITQTTPLPAVSAVK